MGKEKDLVPTQQTTIQLPKVLSDRLLSERESATARIEQINTSFQKTVSLLFEGYAASLDPKKKYTLSNDFKSVIET